MEEALGHQSIAGVAAVAIGWLGLLIISLTLTIYDDHQDLVGAAKRIKQKVNEAEKLRTSERSLSEKVFEGRIHTLETECAVKEGINETLQKQNRDQQLLIGGCQSQAIRLLRQKRRKRLLWYLMEMPAMQWQSGFVGY